MNPILKYEGHIQDRGTVAPVADGNILGTTGEFLRLEAFRAWIENYPDLGIEYEVHEQDVGWSGVVRDGEWSGSMGLSRRIEAIRARLTGVDADKYNLYYGVHAENYGWMGWAENWENAGTEGMSLRLEAVKLLILPVGIELRIDTPATFKIQEQAAAPAAEVAGSGDFGPDEFKCRCGCGLDVLPELKEKAQQLRDLLGAPLIITSGARCEYQNMLDGGITNSEHTKGRAFDSYTPGMTEEMIEHLADLANQVGMSVGRYYGLQFCHSQLEDGEPFNVVWG